MPKTGEKARKLKALSAGKGVRPPKKWWEATLKRVKRANPNIPGLYPQYTKERYAKIVGGIWSQSSVSTKKKIVRRYQK